MPNHVTNIVIISSDSTKTIGDLWNIVRGDGKPDGYIDFNKVIPEPENCYKGDIDLTDRYKYPCNWYDFHLASWGTKWNGYGYEEFKDKPLPEVAEQIIAANIKAGKAYSCTRFLTAWSVPFPIYQKLSQMFPVEVTVLYADEDTGAQCGIVTYLDGKEFKTELKDYSNEAYEWCFMVRSSTAEKEYYFFNNETGKYEFRYPEYEEDG